MKQMVRRSQAAFAIVGRTAVGLGKSGDDERLSSIAAPVIMLKISAARPGNDPTITSCTAHNGVVASIRALVRDPQISKGMERIRRKLNARTNRTTHRCGSLPSVRLRARSLRALSSKL
jgi:hypothetical protein